MILGKLKCFICGGDASRIAVERNNKFICCECDIKYDGWEILS